VAPLVLDTDSRVEQDKFWKRLFALCLSVIYVYGFTVVGLSQKSQPASAAGQESSPWPKSVLALLFLSFPGGIVGGYMTVVLLRTRPWIFIYSAMVWASVILFAAGVLQAITGNLGPGIVICLVATWNAYVLRRWKNGGQLDLVARLLSTACTALGENSHLVSCSISLLVLVTIFIFIPTFGFSIAARNVAPKTGNAFYTFGSIFWLWGSGAAMEVQLYITALVIARWYEMPAGMRLEGNPVLDAFRMATGKGFGSCACGGMVLTLIETVSEVFRRVNGFAGPVFGLLLSFIESLFLRWVEFLTRFNTVRTAVTGESFREAGRNSQALLTRNGCNARAVCYLVPIVLNTICAGGAITYAFVVRIIYAVIGSGQPSWAGILLFLLSFLIVFSVLAFLCSLIQSIVDSLYYCYVSDKERARVLRPDVHSIMHETVERIQKNHHAVVQQPDGELGYGGARTSGGIGQPQTR
jgi:hypothetical protein